MIKQTIDLLGRKGKDKVTGFEGAIISVSFDLFGCVQVAIKPGLDKDGKLVEGQYFDINRIDITDTKRVMELPNWDHVQIPQQYNKGPAEKPRCK